MPNRRAVQSILYGGRSLVFTGVGPVVFAGVAGGLLGFFAGYDGSWVGTLLTRATDVFYSFPSALLAVATSSAMGEGRVTSPMSSRASPPL